MKRNKFKKVGVFFLVSSLFLSPMVCADEISSDSQNEIEESVSETEEISDNPNLEAVNEITITKMESARVQLEFLGNEHNLYDNPGSLREANELLIGSAHKGTVVTGEALYTTSDGEQHYNFQLGGRYYWANSKAFQQAITITKMESARVRLEFLGNEHNLYDNPGSLREANELLIGSAHKGTVVTGEALYTTSDGEQHYNFQLGDRYYWANSKAFQQAITITKMESARVRLEFLGNEHNLYDNPGSLREANELLIGSAYKGTVVTGEALYTTSDGEQHYNFQLGDRYYWANSKAFQQSITITKMESARVRLEFLGNEHNLYDNPGSLREANELLIGSAYKGTVVTGEALYTTSDGEQHYNFQLGDRYYWANSKAFQQAITITKMESARVWLEFLGNEYNLYDNPGSLREANELLIGSAYKGTVVTGEALYTTSDGEQHYNFQLGDRYYWANSKAFQQAITITKMEPARVQLEFLGNEHNLYDNPGSLHEANELLIGSAHKGTVVTGEALYTTSDGEQHYNFKFGDRYYWMNSKGLEKVITITKQESVSTELQIVNGNYDMYNTPQNLKNAMKLEASSAHLQDRIRGTALYTLSDGSRHYNFQLGSRYYWINEKGVTKSTYSRPSAKADFIDVSNHQGDLSQSFYNGLSSQGIQGVVLKVSEGTGFFDKYAKNNYQRARNAGLVTGAYHFARYHSANGAIAEANYFDSKLKAINFDKGSNGYVVLDIEHGIAANAANQTAMANAFINRLRQLGYKNVDMYVGDYYLKSNLHASALAVSNPWIAGYPGTADQSVSSITHTGGMGAWQFTDRYPVGSYRLDASVDYSGKYTGVSSGSYLSGVKMNDFKMIQKDGPIFSRPGAFAHNKVVGNLSTYINRNVQVVSKVVTSDGVYYELVHGNGSIGYVKESNL